MKKTSWRIVLTVAVIALLIGAGFGIYKMGYAQGVVSNFSVEEITTFTENFQNSRQSYGMMPYRFHGHGFGMMGPFGAIFRGLFVIFIVGFMINSFYMHRRMRHSYRMRAMGEHFDGKPPWHHGPFNKKCWSQDFENESVEEDSTEDTSAE